ncbi:hypothetical protein C8R45DRAFT_117344 [Mycena sanguinolenta]|nr:hypothetical protein C8R45DRAFT_117344 [Mycena sanguinolenta]
MDGGGGRRLSRTPSARIARSRLRSAAGSGDNDVSWSRICCCFFFLLLPPLRRLCLSCSLPVHVPFCPHALRPLLSAHGQHFAMLYLPARERRFFLTAGGDVLVSGAAPPASPRYRYSSHLYSRYGRILMPTLTLYDRRTRDMGWPGTSTSPQSGYGQGMG